ncbi:MAG: enolase C-terminal domain-like protein, partial [Arenicellales bacterium]|nr:enolase C-terminal domain-like protein [Arenicellales bacterium]
MRNPANMDGQISIKGAEEATEITAAIREAVGPSIELLIDAHGKYNVPTAIDLARRLEPYDIFWFEEPCPPDNIDAILEVKNNTTIPVVTGEAHYTRNGFREIFDKRAV